MAKKSEAKSIAKQQKGQRAKGSPYAVYDGKKKEASKLASLDSSAVPLSELQKRYTFHDVTAKETSDHKHFASREDHKHKREPRCPIYKVITTGYGSHKRQIWKPVD